MFLGCDARLKTIVWFIYYTELDLVRQGVLGISRPGAPIRFLNWEDCGRITEKCGVARLLCL
jgi:hypothetical protein